VLSSFVPGFGTHFSKQLELMSYLVSQKTIQSSSNFNQVVRSTKIPIFPDSLNQLILRIHRPWRRRRRRRRWNIWTRTRTRSSSPERHVTFPCLGRKLSADRRKVTKHLTHAQEIDFDTDRNFWRVAHVDEKGCCRSSEKDKTFLVKVGLFRSRRWRCCWRGYLHPLAF
jgi:hypothetical protein